MVGRVGEHVSQQRNEVFGALANARRRTILDLLRQRDQVAVDNLAVTLVAAEENRSTQEVTADELSETRLALEHIHLPRLADANLVQWTDDTVAATQHPALEDQKIEAILAVDAPDWDDVLDCLADRRRRIVLATLASEERMEHIELATEVTRRLQSDHDEETTVEPVLQSLHHHHLPMLDDAGLVTYDIDRRQVTYEGHSQLDEEWLEAEPTDTVRAILPTADRPSELWTLEGRASVMERGRTLCASADHELVVLLSDSSSVESASLRQLRNAIDRGVDVYLGTQDEQLRARARQRVPEATIWDPQFDWLSHTSSRERVGRVVMADREQIVVGTIDEGTATGDGGERAVTGTRDDDPVVLLLCELLESRIDHLDVGSRGARSQLQP